MNERRQRVDNQPYGRAFERLCELLFPSEHPYSWPVIGTMEDIAAATLEEVREFFARHYVPNNAILTLAGDFQVDEAAELVERYFGEIGRGPAPARTRFPLPPLTTPAADLIEDDVQLARLYLGWRLPPFGTPEWYAAALLAAVLAEGKSCPLYLDLVYDR